MFLIAQWDYVCVPLSGLCMARGSIPGCGRVFQGILSRTDHTLPTPPEPAQSPLNGTTQPVDIEEEGQSPTMDRHRLQ